jgi:hypothetical protein
VPTRDFLVFCVGVAAICVILKSPSLLYPRAEGDERIYWQLAQSLALGGDYSLRGSELLRELSSYVYDRPLFHHPPLFPALLSLFAMADMENAAVLVSWLGHVLAAIAVAIIGRHILNQHSDASTLTRPAFWLPVLGVSADPLLLFVSRRIWIDSLLSGLTALSVAMLLIAGGKRRRATLAAAGVLLGLAALAKLTALILLPVFVFVCIRDEETWKERAISLAAVLLPVVSLVVPWLLVFYSRNGVFLPSWVKPDERLMQLYPFVRAAVERPWYYYVVKLSVVMPLAIAAVWALMGDRALWANRTVQVAAAWFGTVLVVLTVLGINGYGFQMRHIAPAVTALYVVLLVLLTERDRPLLLVVSAFAMLVGTVTGAMHLLAPQFDEIVSLGRVSGLLSY